MILSRVKQNFQKHLKTRVEFLIFFQLIMLLVTATYIGVFVFIGSYYSAIISTFFTVFLVATFFLNKPKHYFFSAALLVVTNSLEPVTTVVLSGGLDSPYLIWLFVPIYGASFLLGKIGTIFSTIASLFFFTLLFAFNEEVQVFNELDPTYYQLMFYLSFLFAASLMGVLAGINIFSMEKEADAHKILRENAEELNRLLVEKSEEQDKLLSIVSHELRTPAATLSMLLNPKDIAANTLNITSINDNMHHLMDVLDDMRMVKEPEIILETPLNKVYVRDVLENALHLVTSYLENKDLVVDIHESNTTRTLCVFRDKLVRQIAMNIVKNCINHSSATQLDIHIDKKITSEAVSFSIRFTDNGQGIPDHKVATLFTPFVKGVEKSSGSGLGLHLSREFAQKGLHGNLTYRKNSPTGAIFELEFTALKAEKTSTDILQETTPITNNSLKGLTILLAEDNLVIALMTKKLLEEQGATVLDAKDGEVALTLFKSNSIDVVLTDIFMPKINGYELTKALRTLGYKGQIIGCSAASIGEEANELIASGADKVFIKPLKVEEILRYLKDNIITPNS